jgi:hypothetical protein
MLKIIGFGGTGHILFPVFTTEQQEVNSLTKYQNVYFFVLLVIYVIKTQNIVYPHTQA